MKKSIRHDLICDEVGMKKERMQPIKGGEEQYHIKLTYSRKEMIDYLLHKTLRNYRWKDATKTVLIVGMDTEVKNITRAFEKELKKALLLK